MMLVEDTAMTTLANVAGAGGGQRPAEDRELIPADSPLAKYISVNKAYCYGEPRFVGTRVPIQILFDHLREGDGLEVFVQDFPPVTREQAVGVVDLAAMGMLEGLRRL